MKKKTPCCEYAEQNKYASKRHINDLKKALKHLTFVIEWLDDNSGEVQDEGQKAKTKECAKLLSDFIKQQ